MSAHEAGRAGASARPAARRRSPRHDPRRARSGRAAGRAGAASRVGLSGSSRSRRASLAFRRAGSTLPQLARRIAWLLPFVLDARAARGAPRAPRPPAGRAPARSSRGLSPRRWPRRGRHSCSARPASCARARALGAPARLVSVLEAALVSLVGMVERARAMLRAREARRAGPGAWGLLLREPRATLARLRALRRRAAAAHARARRGPGARPARARGRPAVSAQPATLEVRGPRLPLSGRARGAAHACPSASRRASAWRCSDRTAPASRRCCCTSRGCSPSASATCTATIPRPRPTATTCRDGSRSTA